MEPSKIEKQFRKQLNDREIKPSESAWNRLDAMLDVAEKKKNKSRWVSVAASVVGFLLIGTVYFNEFRAVDVNKSTPVVLQQKTDLNNLEEQEIINEDIISNQIQEKSIITQKVVAENNNLKKSTKKLVNKVGKVSATNQNKTNEAAVVSAEKNNYESVVTNKYVRAEELLAEVSNAKFEQKVTDKGIEKNKKSTISVNPNSLLSNAETELNQSFRESALDKLNKKYNAVKTVLANRNYEE
jgi:hypothetical protein